MQWNSTILECKGYTLKVKMRRLMVTLKPFLLPGTERSYQHQLFFIQFWNISIFLFLYTALYVAAGRCFFFFFSSGNMRGCPRSWVLMWLVWKERNRRTFEDTESSLDQLKPLFACISFLLDPDLGFYTLFLYFRVLNFS